MSDTTWQPVLERRESENRTVVIGRALLAPVVDCDYWSYRVLLSEGQAVVGFKKFGTIGIGFAVEGDDWNTNLPYTSDTERIFEHIRRNKGDDSITDDAVREAIAMIQAAVREDRGK